MDAVETLVEEKPSRVPLSAPVTKGATMAFRLLLSASYSNPEAGGDTEIAYFHSKAEARRGAHALRAALPAFLQSNMTLSFEKGYLAPTQMSLHESQSFSDSGSFTIESIGAS